MHRRFLGLVLALIVLTALLPLPVPVHAYGAASRTRAETASPDFLDLPESAELKAAVAYLYERGVVKGTGPDTVNPAGKLDRAMTATLIHRIVLYPASAQSLPYRDISVYAYYIEALRWCHEKGIIRGTAKDRFSPSGLITTEELAVILYRLAEYRKEEMRQTFSLNWIADKAQISTYAQTAICWALDRGYLTGVRRNGKVSVMPRKQLDRGETFLILYRFCRERDLPRQSFQSAWSRSCYPGVTDDSFANFRMVQAAGIAPGVLYRGCSPIDYDHLGARIWISQERIRSLGIQTVINLANTRTQASKMAYYSFLESCPTVEYCAMSEQIASEAFLLGAGKALKALAEHEGPYFLHCTYGKDRSGMIVALLECLMGADYGQIEADYLLSFENYYQIVNRTKQPLTVFQRRTAVEQLRLCLGCTMFGVEDLKTADLKTCAERYCFEELQLSEETVRVIRERLGD